MLMAATRGTALLHQRRAGWTPWAGDLPHRAGGAMISDRQGATTAYALDNLQQRGALFLHPGIDVYEGMVIGEGARGEEMVVNAVRAKEKNNIRTHSHDDGVKLAAPIIHTLETAIEWIADDELVEVTPSKIRIRKRHLSIEERRRAFKK
jgi:GTP-binding protein